MFGGPPGDGVLQAGFWFELHHEIDLAGALGSIFLDLGRPGRQPSGRHRPHQAEDVGEHRRVRLRVSVTSRRSVYTSHVRSARRP